MHQGTIGEDDHQCRDRKPSLGLDSSWSVAAHNVPGVATVKQPIFIKAHLDFKVNGSAIYHHLLAETFIHEKIERVLVFKIPRALGFWGGRTITGAVGVRVTGGRMTSLTTVIGAIGGTGLLVTGG
jgi:hypothetical protein